MRNRLGRNVWGEYWLVIFLTLVLTASSVQGQEEENKQIWLGVLDAKVVKLRLSMELTQNADGTWSGQSVSLDQGNAVMPYDELTVNDTGIRFAIKRLACEFKGKFNEARDEVSGTFTQAGQALPMTFKRVDKITERAPVEAWAGEMQAGPQRFEFQIRLFEENGNRSGVLDSFTELITGLNLELAEEGDRFEFELPATRARYEGVRSEDGQTLTGKWIQSGQAFPLDFRKIPLTDIRTLSLKRPQTPKPPFPYDVKDLRIELPTGIEIEGTLTFPKGEGRFPVVVLVSGSGPQDRDETLFEHRPFAVWADALTRAGLAVFRYDERGVGKSTGNYASATTKDFASDVSGILDHLKTLPNLDPKKMVVMGHSEGGLIAPLVAVERGDLAAVVLLAGPSVTGAEIVLDQSRVISLASGIPQEKVDQQDAMLRRVLDSLPALAADERPSGEAAIKNFFESFLDRLGGADDAEAAVRRQFQQPWFRFFAKYDPREALRKLKTPCLALFGEKDLQVTPALNQSPMEEALKESGNSKYEVVVLPELNHLFQRCETGSPAEYVRIEETLNATAIEKVKTWLVDLLLR